MKLVIDRAGFINSTRGRNCNKIQTETNEPNYISNALTQENSASYLGTQYSDKTFSVSRQKELLTKSWDST